MVGATVELVDSVVGSSLVVAAEVTPLSAVVGVAMLSAVVKLATGSVVATKPGDPGLSSRLQMRLLHSCKHMSWSSSLPSEQSAYPLHAYLFFTHVD